MSNNNDIIDPSEVFIGDDGKAIDPAEMMKGLTDDNGGEPSGSGGDPADKGGQQAPPDNDDNGGNPGYGNEGGDNGGDDKSGDAGDSPDNYANPAEYAFKWLGYETDEVDFGEGPVKLADLTSEQQTDVLLNQLQNVVESYEGEIATLKTGTPQLENPFQQQVFEFLRKNGDPKQLAEYILKNDPNSLASSLPGDELVKRHLKETMGLEGQELDDEVTFLKDSNKIDAYAERIKKLYANKGMDISGLNEQQQSVLKANEDKEIEDYRKQSTDISNYAATVKDISGIPVAREVSDFVSQMIISTNHNEDSAFVKSLDNPQKLYRLAFLDSYFEDIVDNLKKSYFEMGKREVTPASQALSKDPVRVQSFRSTAKPSSPHIGRDGRVDMDKLANAENTI